MLNKLELQAANTCYVCAVEQQTLSRHSGSLQDLYKLRQNQLSLLSQVCMLHRHKAATVLPSTV